MKNISDIWRILESIPDPEIPVINIVELGIVRDIKEENGQILIEITPTYSGCPAMHAIEMDIFNQLQNAGIEKFQIRTVHAPAWTTEWMNDDAKEKLRKYGIAPPGKINPLQSQRINSLLDIEEPVRCPHCHSLNTMLIS